MQPRRVAARAPHALVAVIGRHPDVQDERVGVGMGRQPRLQLLASPASATTSHPPAASSWRTPSRTRTASSTTITCGRSTVTGSTRPVALGCLAGIVALTSCPPVPSRTRAGRRSPRPGPRAHGARCRRHRGGSALSVVGDGHPQRVAELQGRPSWVAPACFAISSSTRPTRSMPWPRPVIVPSTPVTRTVVGTGERITSSRTADSRSP